MLRQFSVNSKRFFASSNKDLKKTKLCNFHEKNGGKMVDFAGYYMPVQYKESIIDSTLHTRNHASIFDVSHMGQLRFYGKDRVKFLESIIVSNVSSLKENQAKYSLLTNEKGGIIDDLIVVNRTNDHNYHYMVVNASRADVDIEHMKNQIKLFKKKYNGDVDIEFQENDSLIAFQGPEAVSILSKYVSNYDFNNLKFFYVVDLDINGIPCQISRSGYTGEDGVEISVSNDNVEALVNILLKDKNVWLAGLGARDALRLEAGLCLYGNDIDETTTPVEANLLWVMSKNRKESGEFLGSDIIRNQIKNGVSRKRVGLIGQKGLSPRSHMKIKDLNGNVVGEVTSGAYSPCLSTPIAMGYVQTEFTDIDTPLKVQARENKEVDVKVTQLPFVTKGYFKN